MWNDRLLLARDHCRWAVAKECADRVVRSLDVVSAIRKHTGYVASTARHCFGAMVQEGSIVRVAAGWQSVGMAGS